MVGAETTSSSKLFHWLMSLCVKKLALSCSLHCHLQSFKWWPLRVESKQIRPINFIKTSQKFIGFNHVTMLSLTVQRINSKFSKSCFIWQVCQSIELLASVPFLGYQYPLPSMGTKVGHNTLGVVLHMSYIRNRQFFRNPHKCPLKHSQNFCQQLCHSSRKLQG